MEAAQQSLPRAEPCGDTEQLHEVSKPVRALLLMSMLEQTDIKSSSDGDFVKKLCNAICIEMSEVSNDAQALGQLVDEGIIEVCMAVLYKHARQTTAINAAFFTMASSLVAHAHAATELGELNGIPLVIRAVLATKNDIDCQMNGLSLLSLMAFDNVNRQNMGEFYGTEVVLSCMKAYYSNRDIVCACCAYLVSAGFESHANREVMLKHDCVEGITQVMGLYREDEEINTWCAMILSILSSHSPAAPQTIGSHDGVHALVNMMVLHKESKDMHIYGFETMQKLTEGNERNGKQFVVLRGLELCVRAMRMFADVCTIQISCAGTLRNIARLGKQTVKKVIASGGIDAIALSMTNLRSCRELQEISIAFFYAVAQIGDDAKSKIGDAKGIDAIYGAMKAHSIDEKVVQEGERAIKCIKRGMPSADTQNCAC